MSALNGDAVPTLDELCGEWSYISSSTKLVHSYLIEKTNGGSFKWKEGEVSGLIKDPQQGSDDLSCEDGFFPNWEISLPTGSLLMRACGVEPLLVLETHYKEVSSTSARETAARSTNSLPGIWTYCSSISRVTHAYSIFPHNGLIYWAEGDIRAPLVILEEHLRHPEYPEHSYRVDLTDGKQLLFKHTTSARQLESVLLPDMVPEIATQLRHREAEEAGAEVQVWHPDSGEWRNAVLLSKTDEGSFCVEVDGISSCVPEGDIRPISITAPYDASASLNDDFEDVSAAQIADQESNQNGTRQRLSSVRHIKPGKKVLVEATSLELKSLAEELNIEPTRGYLECAGQYGVVDGANLNQGDRSTLMVEFSDKQLWRLPAASLITAPHSRRKSDLFIDDHINHHHHRNNLLNRRVGTLPQPVSISTSPTSANTRESAHERRQRLGMTAESRRKHRRSLSPTNHGRVKSPKSLSQNIAPKARSVSPVRQKSSSPVRQWGKSSTDEQKSKSQKGSSKWSPVTHPLETSGVAAHPQSSSVSRRSRSSSSNQSKQVFAPTRNYFSACKAQFVRSKSSESVKSYRQSDEVEVYYDDTKDWFPGTIQRRTLQGSHYDIVFTSGELSFNVPEECIRRKQRDSNKGIKFGSKSPSTDGIGYSVAASIPNSSPPPPQRYQPRKGAVFSSAPASSSKWQKQHQKVRKQATRLPNILTAIDNSTVSTRRGTSPNKKKSPTAEGSPAEKGITRKKKLLGYK